MIRCINHFSIFDIQVDWSINCVLFVIRCIDHLRIFDIVLSQSLTHWLFSDGRKLQNELQASWWYMVPDFAVLGFEKHLLSWTDRYLFPNCSEKTKILESKNQERFSPLLHCDRFSTGRRSVYCDKKGLLELLPAQSHMQYLQTLPCRQCNWWYTRQWMDRLLRLKHVLKM